MTDLFLPAYPLSTRLPSKPILEAIGEVCFHWTRVEVLMDMTVSAFLGGDRVGSNLGMAITASVRSFRTKADMINNLVRSSKIQPSLAQEILEFTSSVNELAEDRNSAVHGYWLCFPGSERRLTLHPKKGDKGAVAIKSEDWSHDRLHSLASRIRDACQIYEATVDKLAEALGVQLVALR